MLVPTIPRKKVKKAARVTSTVDFAYRPINRIRPLEIWRIQFTLDQVEEIKKMRNVVISLEIDGKKQVFIFDVLPQKEKREGGILHIGVSVVEENARKSFEDLLNFHKKNGGKSSLRIVTDHPLAKQLCCE